MTILELPPLKLETYTLEISGLKASDALTLYKTYAQALLLPLSEVFHILKKSPVESNTRASHPEIGIAYKIMTHYEFPFCCNIFLLS